MEYGITLWQKNSEILIIAKLPANYVTIIYKKYLM